MDMQQASYIGLHLRELYAEADRERMARLARRASGFHAAQPPAESLIARLATAFGARRRPSVAQSRLAECQPC